MSAAKALARTGTAGPGEEANQSRARIQRRISASVPRCCGRNLSSA
jgi:hypothetical protein